MTPFTFWSLFAAAVVAVLAFAYGIGWGLTDCPRWFLPCQCRANLPGPAANRDSGSREPVYVGADGRAGEFHDAWEQLDPDQAADQLIAEWHSLDLEMTAEDWIARDLADLELLAWDARVQAARCWEIVHVEFPRLRAELCAA